MMNRIMQFARQINAIRVIGLVLITVFMMMGADHFNIMKTVNWNTQAISMAARVNFDIDDWGSHPNYEQEFGETVFAFYTCFALACFLVAFYLHSSADIKTKIVLGLMSVFMIGAAENFIYQRILVDNLKPSGWWGGLDGFAIQTLSPIAFAVFFGYAYYLLWRATMPNSAPAPGGDSDNIFQPSVARQQGLTKLGGDKEQAEDTPRALAANA